MTDNTKRPGREAVASLFDTTVTDFLDPSDPPVDTIEDLERTRRMIQILLMEHPTGPLQMISRKPRRRAALHPFDKSLWHGWDQTMNSGTVAEVETLALHPHPGARRLAAIHPRLWDDLKGVLAVDRWREVRMAVATNPTLSNELLETLAEDRVDTVAHAARTRLAASAVTVNLLDSLSVCVECATPIKNPAFQTCSVGCSIGQLHRRTRSGLWADAVTVDFRHTARLRKDWPEQFVWNIAGSEKTGSGIPGMGPKYRTVLAPFNRHLTTMQIVDFCSDVRDNDRNQHDAIVLLQAIGTQFPEVEPLTRTRTALGLHAHNH